MERLPSYGEGPARIGGAVSGLTTIAVAILCLLTFAIVGSAVLEWQTRIRRKSRSNYSKEHFVAYFTSKGTTTQAPEIVWDYIMEWLGRGHFPLHPDDTLCSSCALCEEDLDDAVVHIASGLYRREPTADSAKKYGSPVETVADLVFFIDFLSNEGGRSERGQK